MSAPLYALAAEIEALLGEAADPDTDPATADALRAALDGMSEAFGAKAERVALVVRARLAEADVCDAEAEHQHRRAVHARGQAAWLKAYLQDQMDRTGTTVLRGALATVRLQDNPPACALAADLDVAALPARFVREIPATRTVDKRALLEAHKAGETLPAGVSVTRSRSVRIT